MLACYGLTNYYDTVKEWYDGYRFRKAESIYNPNSVMKAIQNEDFDSYWHRLPQPRA